MTALTSIGDARAEPLDQLVAPDPRVLDHVVQHGGGDDLVGVAAAAEQMRDLQRVQDERRVVGVRCWPVWRSAANSRAEWVIGRSSTKLGNCTAPHTLTPWRIAGRLKPL